MRNTINYNMPVFEGGDKFSIADLNRISTITDKAIGDLQETLNDVNNGAFSTIQEVIEARGIENNLKTRLTKSEAKAEEMKNNLINTNSQLAEIEKQKANKNDVAKISSGTPLFAGSVSEMTDITKNYVNTTDGYLYNYSSGIWSKTTVQYQSVGIQEKAVSTSKLADDVVNKLNICFAEEKHKNLVNGLERIGNGDYNSAKIDNCVLSYVDNSSHLVIPKNIKLTHTNSTDLYSSFFAMFPCTVKNPNSKFINGYWINKDFFTNMSDEYYCPIVWFYNNTTLTGDISFNITDKSLLKVGYKNTVVKNGVTFDFDIVDEVNNCYFIQQKVNGCYVNTNIIQFGIFVQRTKTQTTTTLTIPSFVVLEDESFVVPHFAYLQKETVTKARTIVNFGYNLDLPLLKYRSALSKRLENLVKIACIGDSITEGYWTGRNDTLSYPVKLRGLLQAKYGGNDEGFLPSSDTDRFIKIGNWSEENKGIAVYRLKSCGTSNKLTFEFDGTEIDIIYSKASDGGYFQVKLDGVINPNVNGYSTTEILGNRETINGLVQGNHILEITPPANETSYVYIEGIDVKGSINGVKVDRRAKSGSYTGDWNNTLVTDTFASNPVDLFIIGLGVNDLGGGQTVEQFKPRMKNIIEKAKSVGDVIIVPMMQSSDVGHASWTSEWLPVFYDLADECNVGLIDINLLYGGAYQPAQQYGLFGVQNGSVGQEGSDSIHPSARGMQLIADTIFKLIG